MMDESESLPEFLRRLWGARVFVLAGGIIGSILGFFLLLSLQPHYQAHMIVAPALVQDVRDTLQRFEQGTQVPRYYTGGDPVSNEFTRFEQVLREGTVSGILARYDGIVERMGEDRIFSFTSRTKMSAADVPEYLSRHIHVDPVGVTSSRRISYEHPDPKFAAQILKHLHRIADTTIRHKALAETQERITWLQRELAQASNPEHREALAQLLMVQERRRMLASMDQPYAAEMVEPPVVSARPVWPARSLVLLASILCGMTGGFFVAALRRADR